jgi:hypothetical protein
VRQWLDKECAKRDLLDSSLVVLVSDEHSTSRVFAYISADRCMMVYAATIGYTCSAEGQISSGVLEKSDQLAAYWYVSDLIWDGCIPVGDSLKVTVTSPIGNTSFSCQYVSMDADGDLEITCLKELP